jgi:glycosyltransferase involved in cell wall biosynthesis
MKLSFIIPHKGRVEFLRETLESVINQQLPQAITEQEIIVVSQGPPEECQRIRAIFPDVRLYLESDLYTISKLRNSGVARTDAELLAFIDADIRLAPQWVSTCFAALRQDSARVLTSAVQACPVEAGWVERLRCMLGTNIGNRSVSFLDGRNLFTTRSAFEAVGGFPEHLVTCEDFFFTYALSRLGSLYISSEASYVHIGEDKTLRTLFGKEIWRGQSNLQSLKGRTIPLREWPSILIPLLLPMLWLAALGGVVAGWPWFTLAAIGGCFFPVALYSIRASILSKGGVSFFNILRFYTVYFTARALGTWRGAFLWRGAR